jgi:NADPH-dependent 2,4-dienoyl-CoA reductase/sulfur reductase-like enzyme
VSHFPAYVPAEALADHGAEVTLMTPRLSAGGNLDQGTVVTMHRRLAKKGVRFRTHTAAVGTDASGVRVLDTLSDAEGHEPADVVVAAVGNVAVDDLRETLEARGVPTTCVGDALAPRTIVEAVREGQRLGRAL